MKVGQGTTHNIGTTSRVEGCHYNNRSIMRNRDQRESRERNMGRNSKWGERNLDLNSERMTWITYSQEERNTMNNRYIVVVGKCLIIRVGLSSSARAGLFPNVPLSISLSLSHPIPSSILSLPHASIYFSLMIRATCNSSPLLARPDYLSTETIVVGNYNSRALF